jgi:hypothetical protein
MIFKNFFQYTTLFLKIHSYPLRIKKNCNHLGQLKGIQNMQKSTFSTSANTGTIIQKPSGFRQISPGSQNMKLEGLLFSSAQKFKNHQMASGTPLTHFG